MKNILVVIDMQNDFIDGSLGTKEAVGIIDNVVDVINKDYSYVFATLDTHGDDYFSTLEGEKLPVKHCIKGSEGWKINAVIQKALESKKVEYVEKPTFGSITLAQKITSLNPDKITICGLCTDICVISNALLLRAYNPNVVIEVIEKACAGVTVESHDAAISSMRSCQIDIL